MKHRTAILLMASLFGAVFAHADLLTYTETATGSGSLGGTAFTDSLITLTYVANTSNVTTPTSGVFTNATGTLDVSIASLGTAVFTDSVQVVDNQGNILAGFGDNSLDAFILGTKNGAFGSYDLGSPIGPFSGASIINTGSSFGTDRGAFDIQSVSDSTFTATSATPEPGLMTLLGAGLAGLTVFGRKRRSRKSAVASDLL